MLRFVDADLAAAGLCWVDGDLGWGQPEDQPAVADIDLWKLEDATQEGAVRIRILGVEDDWCTVDHGRRAIVKA